MGDGGAELALDVIADDRDAGIRELLRPGRVTRDEDRQSVDEGDPRIDGGLGVILRPLLRTDGEVTHQHLRARVAKSLRDIDGRRIRLADHVAVVLAQAVESRAALHRDAGCRHLRKAQRVVLALPHGIRQVESDLRGVDIKSRDERDIADRISAETSVHEAGDGVVIVDISIERDALDKCVGTVSDTGNGNPEGHVWRAP